MGLSGERKAGSWRCSWRRCAAGWNSAGEDLLDEAGLEEVGDHAARPRAAARDRLSRSSGWLRTRSAWARRFALGAAASTAVVAGLAVAELMSTAAASTTGPLQWSSPIAVDTGAPYSNPDSFNGMSCASSSLCAGVTEDGEIVTSSDPTGSSASDWSVLPSSLLSSDATGYALGAVSCSSSGGTFCAVGGANELGGASGSSGYGVLLTSTNPTGGKAAWTNVAINDAYAISFVSCPAASACFALDDDGRILTNASKSWTTSSTPIVSSGEEWTGLSCPSASLCVAVDSAGNGYVSKTPATLTSTSWAPQPTGLSDAFGGVSCSSGSYCVALSGSSGSGETATIDPSASSPTWTTHAPTYPPSGTSFFTSLMCGADTTLSSPSTYCYASSSGGLYTSTDGAQSSFGTATLPSEIAFPVVVGCTGSSLCVGGDRGGNVISTTNPGAGTGATWSTPVLVARGQNSIQFGDSSCPTSTLCIGTDRQGRLITDLSGTPTLGTLDAGSSLTAAVCPSANLCVVGDGANIAASTDPAGGVPWRITKNVDPNSIFNVVCPSTSLCVGEDQSGDLVTSTDPAAGTWSQPFSVDSGSSLSALSCPTTTLCVGVDYSGNVVSSTNPAGGASAWTTTAGVDSRGIFNLACAPGTSTCVAIDSAGYVVSSTDPTGGASAWSVSSTPVDSSGVQQLDCPSASLCVGYDGSGDILSSSDPTGGAASWSVTTTPPSGQRIDSLTCPSAALCVAGDVGGNALVSTDPAGGASAWSVGLVDSGNAVQSASCSGDGKLCVLADSDGNIVESLPPSGTSTTSTTATTTTATTTTAPTPTTGTVGTGVVGKPKVSGLKLRELLRCFGTAAQQCRFTVTLTTIETVSRKKVLAVSARKKPKKPKAVKKRVTLAKETVTLSGGESKTITVGLSHAGQMLLARFGRLPVVLTVTAGSRSAMQKVTFTKPRPRKKPRPKKHR